MAPSRRKGTSKAAAAAAARRQWKVGDLVLAKVKGFPAWPATVSEPEKWGYSKDWKKVLVYFFGTQQIAFCNPADVEAFTEEKKQSLLGKRQGRGADFVRAVQEIVDSYEKLKREVRVEESTGAEVTAADVSNLDLSANLGSNDQTEAPELTLSSLLKSSNLISDKNEQVCVDEDALGTALGDKSSNKEVLLEDPTVTTAATVKSPLPVTYSSRKRSSVLRPQGIVKQRKALVRRSRSSSRARNLGTTSSDGGKSTGDMSANNAVQNVSVRRNIRIRKSPDMSGCDDVDSSAFASNGSMDENDSEILTIESDAYSPNDGSTLDSDSKPEHLETVECLERDVEFNKGLDLEIKDVVNKKKRKPNRKRPINDAARATITPEEEAGVLNTTQGSQNMCGNFKERGSEQDGDEHLPLLKRIRVRMGKSSSTDVEPSSTVQTQEKSTNGDVNSLQQIITSSNCESGSPADGNPSALNVTSNNASPSKAIAPCFESGSQISELKKEQTFGCSVDGEAVLPPSKRLHRALEAMSANAAAEGQTCTEASNALVASSDRCCVPSIRRCPNMAPNNSTGGNSSELQVVDICGNDSNQVNMYSFSANSDPMILTENESSIQVDKQLTILENHDIYKCAPSEEKQESGDDFCDSLVHQTVNTDSQIQCQGNLSTDVNRKLCEVGSHHGSPGSLIPPNDEDKIRTMDYSKKASSTSEHTEMSLNPVSDVNDNVKILPQTVTNISQNEVAIHENTECLKLHGGDSSKINDMHEITEVKCKETGEDVNSVSNSDDCLAEKHIGGPLPSPSLTDGVDCHPPGSPPNTSVCNVSTSDSSNILQTNGSCSPDVHLHQKQTLSDPFVDEGTKGSVATQRSRSMGKSTEAGHAALLYFEATIGTLTRTKESIGRATHIAIDCAKFGIASKVVEILAHSLETESSLRRRVDLFFLVDSITQCSRGLKGDVGGVYPSAIQAVLPRLLSAAAPPGSTAQENRRQCLKVLKLWLQRKILPESIIRRHIRELDPYNGSASSGAFSRRTLRTERALDDPYRDMEGMLVDEYGSNSSFQLPGFCMPRMLKDEDEDEGSDSDGGHFEAVTPEHNSVTHEVLETMPTIEKHRHILEDVDGELEMEDVAPSCDVEMNSFCNIDEGKEGQVSHNQLETNLPLTSGSPLTQNVHPPSPPPPSSPPPPPPPPPPPLHIFSATADPYISGIDSKFYTDAQTMQDNSIHAVAQPLDAPRNSQPVSEAVHYHIPECRDIPLRIPESTSSFSSFPVPPPPPDNFWHSDAVNMHNKGYPLPPPQHVPSSQFSYVHGERHLNHQREVPPPSYSNRHHFAPSMERENFYNNHERLKPPPYEFRERWRPPAPYPGPRYPDKGMPAPYGCHPESPRLPDHGWRYPPRTMNHRNSMPFRPPFEDAIPVASRGPSFWRPR